MPVQTSTVKTIEDTTIPSTNSLKKITLTGMYETIAPEGAFKVGEKVLWIPAGTLVQRKSPIRKFVKGSIVKSRTICGVKSEGLAYPIHKELFDDDYPTEFEICRRYLLIPKFENESTKIKYGTRVSVEDTRWIDQARICSADFFAVYEHETLQSIIKRARLNGFDHLENGREELIPEGDFLILASKKFEGKGSTQIKINGYEDIVGLSAYSSGYQAGADAAAAMFNKYDLYNNAESVEVAKDRDAIVKFLKNNDKIALSFVKASNNKFVLLGGIRLGLGRIIPAEKIMARLQESRVGMLSNLLIQPVEVIHDHKGCNLVESAKKQIAYELGLAKELNLKEDYLNVIRFLNRTVTKADAAVIHCWILSRCLDTHWYKENIKSNYKVRCVIFRAQFNKENKGSFSKELLMSRTDKRNISDIGISIL